MNRQLNFTCKKNRWWISKYSIVLHGFWQSKLDRTILWQTHKNAREHYISYFPALTNYENFLKAANKAVGGHNRLRPIPALSEQAELLVEDAQKWFLPFAPPVAKLEFWPTTLSTHFLEIIKLAERSRSSIISTSLNDRLILLLRIVDILRSGRFHARFHRRFPHRAGPRKSWFRFRSRSCRTTRHPLRRRFPPHS